MAKIGIELTASAQQLFDATDLGAEGLAKLAAQGKVTRDSLKTDFEAAGKSKHEFNKAIEATVKQLATEGKTIDALITKYGSAQKAQKAIVKELSDMAVAGQRGTAAFKELSAIAGELKDTIDDTRSEIKALSSDTGSLDKLAEGGRAVAGAFSLGAGAAALFAGENEDVQKSVQKAQGALALLSGAQELATIATAKGGFATGVATAAQSLYTLVVGESVGALKLLRVALAATGIGAALFILYEFITAWGNLKTSLGVVEKEMKKLLSIQQQHTEIMKAANEEAAKEIAQAEILARAIGNQKLPREERLKALKEYNKTSQEGNQIAVAEIDNLGKINEQLEKQKEFLIAVAIVKASQNLLSQKIQEQLDLELEARGKLQDAENKAIKATREAQLGLSADPAIAAAQKKQLEAIVQVGQQASAQAIADKKDEIKILLGLITGYEEKYKNVLLGLEGEKVKKLRELVSQVSTIDKKQIEASIGEVVAAFKSINIPITEQLTLLRALGFNPQAIGKALSEAYNEDVFKDVKIQKVPVTFELKDGIDKRPLLELFGQKIPVGLDISQEELDRIADVTKGVVTDVVNSINTSFDLAIQAQQKFIDKLDQRIDKQKEVVAREEELAKRGAANNLQLETDKLNKLNESREKALEKQKKIKNAQVALDTITQLSALVTAAAQIYSAYAPIIGGSLIATGLVAAMFGAFAAQKIAAAVLSSQSEGFREGGYTGDGDPSEESTAIGKRPYKYHKKEFVMREDLTTKHRDFFEALHVGDKFGIIHGVHDLLEGTGVLLPNDDLPQQLFEAKEMHLRISNEEQNSEIRGLRTELKEIKAELTDWKNKPAEHTTSVNGALVTKKGNRTVIKTTKP